MKTGSKRPGFTTLFYVDKGYDKDSSIFGPFLPIEHLILLKSFVKLIVSRRESFYGSVSCSEEAALPSASEVGIFP
jgi:hypothetical protein